MADRRLVAAVILALAASGHAAAAEPDAGAVEATTAAGEKVLLHPNGRWEYVNPQKAAAARKVAEQFPENQGCPPGSQGNFFGFGRCIPPGDKDYNRGSLNPNRR
ncbi:MAG TPA: hypothetical protein VFC14_09725 [Burkholderiales bacterium]|nr:hypothetical protein [Burkholderiales bacterium]